jgi:hypothetical protein
MQTQNFNRKHRQMRRSRKYAMVLVLEITQGAPVYGHRAAGLRTLRNVLGSLLPWHSGEPAKKLRKRKKKHLQSVALVFCACVSARNEEYAGNVFVCPVGG